MRLFKALRHSVFSFVFLVYASFSSMASEREWVKHLSQEAFVDFAQQADTVVIDLRTKREYAKGYIPGAINLPHRDIIKGKLSLDAYKDKKVVFYCHTGVRVGIVNQYLERNPTLSHDNVYHLKGDFRAWRARGNNIVMP